ncbi:hypothetical protein Tco_1328376 [Tanacetum coccineum]
MIHYPTDRIWRAHLKESDEVNKHPFTQCLKDVIPSLKEPTRSKDDDSGVGGSKAEDLQKPFNEILRSPFTWRTIEFLAPKHLMPINLKIYDESTDSNDHINRFVGAENQGEWQMPIWCRMFLQMLDGAAKEWFDRLPNGCIDNCADLSESFMERFALRKKCFKDLTEISMIVRRAN